MKKLLLSLGLLASALVFSGCGGGDDNYIPPVNDAVAVNITDLPAGYQFDGTIEEGKKAGENAVLIFCPDKTYAYYRGSDEKFSGKYKINDSQTEVIMKDDKDHGSYALQTPDGAFIEGEFYKCRGLDKYTTGMRIRKIIPHSCPNHQ